MSGSEISNICMFQLSKPSRSIKGQSMKQLNRPPAVLTFSKIGEDNEKEKRRISDVSVSKEKFEKIVEALKRESVESFTPRPLDNASFVTARSLRCPSCSAIIFNFATNRPRNQCEECGLKFARSRRIVHSTSKADSLRNLYGKYVYVYKRSSSSRGANGDVNDDNMAASSLKRQPTTGLLVPPINYYPGDLSRKVLPAVNDALDAQAEGRDLVFDTERQRVAKGNDKHAAKRHVRESSNEISSCGHTVTRQSNFKRKRIIEVPVANEDENNTATMCTPTQPKKREKRITPQRSLCYLPTLCSRIADRVKHGKENIFRSTCVGRVIAGCARLTVGTNGSVPAGEVRLPTSVITNLGDNATAFFNNSESVHKRKAVNNAHYLSIRYPVIAPGNITYAYALPGGQRSTADVPSSQCKYNGGDNDGDAFNFIRLNCGMLCNSVYEVIILMAPWWCMSNGGDLKVEFDSDAKLGLGIKWKKLLHKLRTNYFIYGNSRKVYDEFVKAESVGRMQSKHCGTFNLDEYLQNDTLNNDYQAKPLRVPLGAIAGIINSDAVSRFTASHLFQDTISIGPLRFPYNSSPARKSIDSSYVSGLTPSELIASAQATFDANAEQKSADLSLRGNMQYQFEYVPRPMVLVADRQSVINPVTKALISTNVSSLYAQTKAKACGFSIAKAAIDFALLVVGLCPVPLDGADRLKEDYESLAREAKDMRHILTTTFNMQLPTFKSK